MLEFTMYLNNQPDLIEALQKDKVVFFIGAGISMNLINKEKKIIGNWEQLVSHLLNYLQLIGYNIENLRDNSEKLTPLLILEFLESENLNINKIKIYNFICNYFDLDFSNDFELQKKIKLVSSKIITTNYDRAFEIANSDFEKNNEVIINGNSIRIEKLKNSSHFLFKLHGCITNETSIIFLKSDYEKLYDISNIENRHLLYSLKNIFYNNTIFFMGYSMNDVEIELILKDFKNLSEYTQKHFIVLKKTMPSKFKDYLTPIYINDYSEINLLMEEMIQIKKTDNVSKETLLSNLKLTAKNLAEELRKEAFDHFKNNNYELSLNKLRQSRISDNPFNLANIGSTQSFISRHKKDEKGIEEGILSLRQSIKWDEENFVGYYGLANELMHYSKIKIETETKVRLLIESIHLFEHLFEKFDINNLLPTIIYNQYGCALLDLGNNTNDDDAKKTDLYKKSIKAFKYSSEKYNVYESFSNWGLALLNLSKINNNQSLLNIAIEKCEKSISLVANNACAFATLGNIYSYLYFLNGKKVDDLNLSIVYYENAVKYDSNSVHFINNLALSYYSLSFHSILDKEKFLHKSNNLFQTSNIIDDSYPPTYYLWSSTLFSLAEINKDNKLLQQSLEMALKYKNSLTKEDLQLSHLLAKIFFSLKNEDNSYVGQCIENLIICIESNHELADCCYLLGTTYYDIIIEDGSSLKELIIAFDSNKEAYDIFGWDFNWKTGLALIFEYASSLLRKSLEIAPESSFTYNNLGVLYLERAEKHTSDLELKKELIESSIKMSNLSIEYNVNNYKAYNSLGNALLLNAISFDFTTESKIHQLNESIKSYQDAIKILSENAPKEIYENYKIGFIKNIETAKKAINDLQNISSSF